MPVGLAESGDLAHVTRQAFSDDHLGAPTRTSGAELRLAEDLESRGWVPREPQLSESPDADPHVRWFGGK